MTLSRTDYGSYHLISGTVQEVFEELGYSHVMPENIVYMKVDGTAAIFQKGLANKYVWNSKLTSDSKIA